MNEIVAENREWKRERRTGILEPPINDNIGCDFYEVNWWSITKMCQSSSIVYVRTGIFSIIRLKLLNTNQPPTPLPKEKLPEVGIPFAEIKFVAYVAHGYR